MADKESKPATFRKENGIVIFKNVSFLSISFQPELYVHFDVLTLIPLITIKDDIPKQTE